MSTHPIRFGILCNGTRFPRWQAEAIARLLERDDVECALLIVDERSRARESRWSMIRRVGARGLPWLLYTSLIKRSARALRPVDLSDRLRDVPVIETSVVMRGRFTELLPDETIARIADHDLDFILRFGFGIVRGAILRTPRFGVWSFHHDDERRYRGGPPCFWEIHDGDPVTGAVLQRLTERLDAGVILKRGTLRTKAGYRRNRDNVFLESARWPAQLCVDIREGRVDAFDAEPSATDAPIRHAPTLLQIIRYLLVVARRRVAALVDLLLYIDHWNIAVVDAPIDAFLGERPPPERVTWSPLADATRFAADPFGIETPGGAHVLYEEFPYARRRGNIAAVASARHGGDTIFTDDRRDVVVDRSHLSYPYLVEHGGAIHLIPESYQARQVRLYTAERFPDRWRLDRVLIDGFAGIDPTILFHEGTWWLFATDKEDGPHHNLKLFIADELHGPWRPHPKNPVVTDIRAARPAGTPFTSGGMLYRPAMDYSEKVEGRITINRVVTMTPTDYVEEPVRLIEPYAGSPYPDKIHTLAALGERTLIDGCRRVCVVGSVRLMRYKWGDLRGPRSWSRAEEPPPRPPS